MNDFAADSLPGTFRRLAALALLAASALVQGAIAAPATAPELPDPTRPPMAQRHAVSADRPAAAKADVPVLQSILIGEGRTPSVIINGQAVELGASLDTMKLTQVTETGAVLSGPHGTTVLTLTPGTDKFASTASTVRLASGGPAAAERTSRLRIVRVAEQQP